MRKHGNKESTINVRRVYCTQFLCSLESQGLRSIGELQPIHIYDAFISTLSKEGLAAIFNFKKKLGIHKDDKLHVRLNPKYATQKVTRLAKDGKFLP
ncbi:hypothetical protein G9F73_005230 [Clostridium estertheticum]|uniref:hypothetical protein n=1 Tax=Clostridium estertheticum TaxID=238834 RepID=UPI0013EEC0CB|nr:hypothetical protein [Clostridium estertheticum]MBZ9607227.1 hypothetical protein [Clostridium estertheticum]